MDSLVDSGHFRGPYCLEEGTRVSGPRGQEGSQGVESLP